MLLSITSLQTVYPSARFLITIKMNNALAGQYYYTVSSITGQIITAAGVQVNNGVNQIKIDLTKTSLKGVMIIHPGNTQKHLR